MTMPLDISAHLLSPPPLSPASARTVKEGKTRRFREWVRVVSASRLHHPTSPEADQAPLPGSNLRRGLEIKASIFDVTNSPRGTF